MRKTLHKPQSKPLFRLGHQCLICMVVICSLVLIGGNLYISSSSYSLPEKVDGPLKTTAEDLVHTVGKATKPDHLRHQQERIQKQSASDREGRSNKNRLNDNNGEETVPLTDQKYHLIFSTSCFYQHDWQSYLFFFQAMTLKQPGNVTRIVSGCNPTQQEELQHIHDSQIATMSDRFHIHFTPEFGKKESKSWQLTKYWNKPFGVKHWLENRLGYPHSNDHDDDIVILVDPDMLLQRPFLNDFSQFPDDLWTRHVQNNPHERITKVSHGHPIAQDYNFGEVWLESAESNLTHVVGPESPVHKVTKQEANIFYPAGPPYILTIRDMYRVVVLWSEFLPRLFELNPQFMAEMYGYCMAAAHLGLKHQLARGFMVSNIEIGNGEGWYFLNDVKPQQVCQLNHPLPNVPHVIHFCQRYSIGEFFFSKYRYPDILQCDMPLIQLPPSDIAAVTNYSHYGDNSIINYTDDFLGRRFKLRNAFMTCAILSEMQRASRYYKQRHCPDANFNETWNFFVAERGGKFKPGKR